MPNDRLVEAAEALVNSVDFDNNGVMVGNVFKGGNGGMISLKTIRCADDLRKALDSYRRMR